MIRLISVSAMLVSLLILSMSVYAQGNRPDGAGSGVGNRRLMSQQRGRADAMRQQAEMRRQEAAVRWLAADARIAEAEAKRAAAEEHKRSEETCAAHPPNEHVAEEAFLAEENAENQNLRDERPDLVETIVETRVAIRGMVTMTEIIGPRSLGQEPKPDAVAGIARRFWKSR